MKSQILISIAAFCGGAFAQVALYGQCGGANYQGDTTCAADTICACQSQWYSQCRASGYVFPDRQASCDGASSGSDSGSGSGASSNSTMGGSSGSSSPSSSSSSSSSGTGSAGSSSPPPPSSSPQDTGEADECPNEEDETPASDSTGSSGPVGSTGSSGSTGSTGSTDSSGSSDSTGPSAMNGSTHPASSSEPAPASSSSSPAVAVQNKMAKPVVAANKQVKQVQKPGGSDSGDAALGGAVGGSDSTSGSTGSTDSTGSQSGSTESGGTPSSGTQQGSGSNTSPDPSSAAPPPASSSSSPTPNSDSSTPATPASGSADINKGACTPFTGSKAGYAHTTNYYDGTVGACGCGSGGSMLPWSLQPPSGTIYTAAGSQQFYGSGEFCGSGCGKCYLLTNTGYAAGPLLSDCKGGGETMTVMMTNRCPQEGNEQWCSSPDKFGFDGHFDIMAKDKPMGWDNAVVKYESIPCPGDLSSDYKQCECAGKSRMMRSLMSDMGASGF